MNLDINTPKGLISAVEGAQKTIHDLQERQKTLAQRGDSLAESLETKTQELGEALKAISESVALQQRHESDLPREYRAYMAENGTVQMAGVDKGDDYVPGLLDAPDIDGWHAEVKEVAEARAFLRVMAPGAPTPRTDRRAARLLRTAPSAIRRAFADASGVGAEWIPDVELPTLVRDLEGARVLAAAFQTFPMSAKTVILPALTVGGRPYKAGSISGDDPAQYTSSTPTTASRTRTAVTMAVRYQIDEEAAEDAILPAIPILREQIIRDIVDGEEDAIVNGDATASHQDTGLTGWNIRSRWGSTGLGGSGDHRRLWTGLRARATDVSNTTDMSSVETAAGMLAQMAKLDSPHGLADGVAYVTSLEWMLLKVMDFDEVQTVDKFGPQATILRGQVGSIFGKPIIISEFVDKEYNASGIYDNSTKTKTGLLTVNRSRFWRGTRSARMVELDRDITRGLVNMVAKQRGLFMTIDGTTEKNVGWGYNLTAS